jgi:hypothetical protein
MYKIKLQNSEPSEHLQIAVEMANSLIDRFMPQEQNEALELIHSIVKENRQRQIDDADKKAAWLKETFQQL